MNWCVMCKVGYHTSCLSANCHCANTGHEETEVLNETIPDQSSDSDGSSRFNSDSSSRRGKSDRSLKDQQSTGRKRAAKLYPLDREAPCEWQRKANCGGGPHPLVGCLNGLQEARHHGPDKSTTNNEEGNVHRICHRCHYNWHALNDGEYDWNETIVNAHNPTDCTDEQLMSAAEMDLKYMANKNKRMKIKD